MITGRSRRVEQGDDLLDVARRDRLGAARRAGRRRRRPPSPSLNTWSIGKSRNVGPECGAIDAASASSTSPAISSGESAVAASLVSGATNGTWSISCSDPIPQRSAGARPPSTTIGDADCCAEAIALMPLVTPGPAVSAATPGVRVTFAQPSAANVAACSWRVSTMSIPSARQPS